jgi:hypothetical protein
MGRFAIALPEYHTDLPEKLALALREVFLSTDEDIVALLIAVLDGIAHRLALQVLGWENLRVTEAKPLTLRGYPERGSFIHIGCGFPSRGSTDE